MRFSPTYNQARICPPPSLVSPPCGSNRSSPLYNDYTNYSSLIGWNLAIAYLKDNDKSAARDILTQFAIKSDNVAVQEKAKEVMGKMEHHTILSQSGLLFAGTNKAWRGMSHENGYDGILTYSGLMKMDLSNCRLVVLSACKSALGEDRNPTSMPFGVAYALKTAGVD
jgi:CHAT domain-containing protein